VAANFEKWKDTRNISAAAGQQIMGAMRKARFDRLPPREFVKQRRIVMG